MEVKIIKKLLFLSKLIKTILILITLSYFIEI